MAATITVQEAQQNFAQILMRLKAGEEEIIIAQDETPVARLMPAAPLVSAPQTSGRRVPGSAKGEFVIPPEFYDDLPEDIFEVFK